MRTAPAEKIPLLEDMTLLDYFAAKVICGYAANADALFETEDDCVEAAYSIAAAALEARKKYAARGSVKQK